MKAADTQELQAMPIETKEQASVFLMRYREKLRAESIYGTVVQKTWKPFTVRHPELVEKASIAQSIAEEHFWQMPYESAIKKPEFWDLPKHKWESEREKRGIAVSATHAEELCSNAKIVMER
jgi:hypothetical protein